MQIDKNAVINHLKMINAAGIVQDVLLQPDLSCRVLVDDSGLMVVAKGLDGVTLDEPVGVLDLKLLLSILRGIDNDEVYMSVQNNRLHVYSDTVNFNLLTCAPDYVSTHKTPEQLDKIVDFVDKGEVCSATLSAEFVNKMNSVYGIIGADVTHINIDPDGSQFVIGNTSQNEVSVEFPDLTCEQPMSVPVPSRVLLASISNMVEQELVFTGEGSLVAVNGDRFRYIMSPVAGV